MPSIILIVLECYRECGPAIEFTGLSAKRKCGAPHLKVIKNFEKGTAEH